MLSPGLIEIEASADPPLIASPLKGNTARVVAPLFFTICVIPTAAVKSLTESPAVVTVVTLL